MEEFTIFYAKPQFSRDLNCSAEEAKKSSPALFEMASKAPSNTHVPLATIRVNKIEEVYSIMQGEHWSSGDRQADAQEMIQDAGLTHTSMKMGDLVLSHDSGVLYFCDYVGFTRIGYYHGEAGKELSRMDLPKINDLYPIIHGFG